MNLVQIPPENVDQVWPLITTQLSKAEERSGGSSIEADKDYIKKRMKQLWVVLIDTDEQKNKVVCAGITSLEKCPDGTQVMNIEMLGGDEMKYWFQLKDELETWAKSENRDKVRFWGRKAWLRKLPDYKITHYLMEKELR